MGMNWNRLVETSYNFLAADTESVSNILNGTEEVLSHEDAIAEVSNENSAIEELTAVFRETETTATTKSFLAAAA